VRIVINELGRRSVAGGRVLGEKQPSPSLPVRDPRDAVSSPSRVRSLELLPLKTYPAF